MLKLILTFAGAVSLAACATAEQPAVATNAPGMVSAADPRAAAAGAEILRQGGSAADAAFATLLALNVVEPQSSGIGGGGFLVYSEGGRDPVTYDGRETAPSAATGTWLFKDGRPMPFGEARPGGKSVGVPGNIRMMAEAHEKHGKLPWSALFQPAIRLARDGFQVTPRLFNALSSENGVGGMSPQARQIFFGADGKPLPVGSTVEESGVRGVPRAGCGTRSGQFLRRPERAGDRRGGKRCRPQSRADDGR